MYYYKRVRLVPNEDEVNTSIVSLYYLSIVLVLKCSIKWFNRFTGGSFPHAISCLLKAQQPEDDCKSHLPEHKTNNLLCWFLTS